MDGNMKVFGYQSIHNDIFYELGTIRIKIDDEDKTLRLIWSLSSSNEDIKPILIYENETLRLIWSLSSFNEDIKPILIYGKIQLWDSYDLFRLPTELSYEGTKKHHSLNFQDDKTFGLKRHIILVVVIDKCQNA